jgi:membrane fusion protein, multidrug efflux system
MILTRFALLFIAAAMAFAQTQVEVARVVSRPIERTVRLPGEFLPYQSVEIRARVPGYIEHVLVDRGSRVRKGELLVVLTAPEMKAQIAEAQSREQSAVSQRAEAEARLAAAQATYQRLQEAAKTAGAISGNELDQAAKSVDAARAAVQAAQGATKAAHAAVQALLDLQAYLKVTAPFGGVITDRYVHPGALAGPNAGPLLKLEDTARLRLVVPVPEADTGGIVPRARVTFTVPAFPGRSFQGTVARNSHSMEPKTRTLALELDVANPGGTLVPGMFPEVSWPVRRKAALMVPATSVVTTTERTFVIKVRDGAAEWVTVRKGAVQGDQVEVYGPLSDGDEVVKRASDEIREGSRLTVKR